MKTFLEDHPLAVGVAGTATSIGTGVVSALHMMNEILQATSLLIGTTVGLLTLLHIIKGKKS